MPIHADTFAYRRRLPHLRAAGKTYFVTFCTFERAVLAPKDRSIALAAVTYEHERSSWIEAAVVMPDHVHLVATPFEDHQLQDVVARIKSVSGRQINRRLRRSGHVWQHESFDHILRSNESRRTKGEYIVNNPVRAGIVTEPDAYPWVWRCWVEGAKSAPRAAEGGGATHGSCRA